MDGDLKAAIAVILTSVVWLIVLLLNNATPREETNLVSYRLGYAEGAAGLPERWQYADFSLFWSKEGEE